MKSKRQYPADAVNCADCGEGGLRPSDNGQQVYCVTCGAKRFVPGYREAVEKREREAGLKS